MQEYNLNNGNAKKKYQILPGDEFGGIFCTQKKYPILLKLSLHRCLVYTKGTT